MKANRSVERAPNSIYTYVYMASAYVELDRLDDASDAIKTVLEISPQFTVKWLNIFMPFRVDEVRNRFLDNSRKAGLPEG